METVNVSHIFFAILGGGLPVLIWLWFWLREDKKNPEPKKMIFKAFLAGILSVIVSLASQVLLLEIITQKSLLPIALLLPILITPITEEFFKFTLCYLMVMINKETDEPIDPLIYIITTALGFAALENILYIFEPITQRNIIESVITGNMRFIGATMVHTISSASVGIFLAFSFYKSKTQKIIYAFVGLVIAIILHSYFNLFIIKGIRIDGTEGSLITFFAFVISWLMAIALIFFFEKVKKIKPKK